jgi:hypothetical protein
MLILLMMKCYRMEESILCELHPKASHQTSEKIDQVVGGRLYPPPASNHFERMSPQNVHRAIIIAYRDLEHQKIAWTSMAKQK